MSLLPNRHTRETIVYWLTCRAAVTALSRRRLRRRLAIVMFHGVEARPLSPPCWHVLDVTTFRRQLQYIRRHFRVLPIEEALERLENGTLPDRAAALTFDDGTRNLATQAAPVLRELGLPASVFLATGPMGTDEALWPDRLWLALARTTAAQVDLTPIGRGVLELRTVEERGAAYGAAVDRFKELPDAERIEKLGALIGALGQDSTDPGPFRLLSWDEARAMAADGLVTLHPHSVTHPILSTCDDAKVDHEIVESCAALERETASATNVFAYPNGRARDFDERARAALRRRGVRWALSTTNGYAAGDSDRLALPRIPIGSDLSFARFRLLMSGTAEFGLRRRAV